MKPLDGKIVEMVAEVNEANRAGDAARRDGLLAQLNAVSEKLVEYQYYPDRPGGEGDTYNVGYIDNLYNIPDEWLPTKARANVVAGDTTHADQRIYHIQKVVHAEPQEIEGTVYTHGYRASVAILSKRSLPGYTVYHPTAHTWYGFSGFAEVG